MKSKLLKKLKEACEIVSGETLSKHLGVSRVAIWKHIQKLQACGYDIHAGPKGYRLIRSPDTPFPWEIPERESRIHFFDSAGSTMDIARNLARKGCPDFTVVIAETQTSGRGRMDRNWWSPAGGLYFTLVIRPHIPPVMSPLINFGAAVVLARTLQEICGVDARVKWPNDILIHGKKVAGMLSEMEAAGDQVSFVNIGIGINMNNDLPSGLPTATSVRKISGKICSRKAFLTEFLNRLEKQASPAGSDQRHYRMENLFRHPGETGQDRFAPGCYRGNGNRCGPQRCPACAHGRRCCRKDLLWRLLSRIVTKNIYPG